jgi:hypothetical protein
MLTETWFVLLTLACAAALVALIWSETSAGRRAGALVAIVLLGLWLGGLAVAARLGFFEKIDSRPPRMALVFLPIPLTVLYLGLSRRVSVWVGRVSAVWLLGLQVFRLPVELLLVRLHREGLIPRSMTFKGRNFDIVIGVTAPVAAYVFWRRAGGWRATRKLLIAWNILGMITVINVAVTGALSAPSPLRLLFEDYANTAVQRFPYVWLPGFLVPLALGLHVLFLRSLKIRADVPLIDPSEPALSAGRAR